MRAYTNKAKKALRLAEKASKSLQNNYVGTEHILLGLLKEGTGVAARVLADNRVDPEQLLDLIENLIAPAGGAALEERDGYTPRAQQILENAGREAERFSSREIGTEHLLFAIIHTVKPFCLINSWLNSRRRSTIKRAFHSHNRKCSH